MILRTISSSLLALLLVVTSTASFAGNASAATTRASAQASVSTENDTSRFGWGNWYRNKPSIVSINPTSSPIGTTVTLTGRKFSDDSIVRFGRGVISDPVVSDDGKTLTFTVPEDMNRYCVRYWRCSTREYDVDPGKYNVRVQDGSKTSNTVRFEVTATTTNPDEPLTITEINGPVALDPGEEGTWKVDVEGEVEGNLQYSVKWGDEEPTLLRFMSSDAKMQSSTTFTHTYDDEGTYHPEFTVTDSDGNEVTKVAKAVVISDDESDPPHIDSVSPTSATVKGKIEIKGSGFSEGSTVKIGTTSAVDVMVKSETVITFAVPNLALGTYAVTVTDEDGTSNSVDFKVIVQKGKVSISGIDAPNRLRVGEEGTWTLKANSNMEGNLQYSADWGEGSTGMKRMQSASIMTQSSATFTHAYDVEGTYHPKFTVTNEEGRTANVSASVVVAGELEEDNE